MSFIQTETIRSGGVVMQVPINARLQRYRDQQAEFTQLATEARLRIQKTEAEIRALDHETAQITDVEKLTEVSTARQRLAARLDAEEYALKHAETQGARASQEFSNWSEHFANWMWRRVELIRELSTAHDGEEEYYLTSSAAKGQARSKATVKRELGDINQKLEAFAR